MPVYTLDNEDLARAYSALGEFLVEFQITCWNLRFCYLTLLKRHGLANMALAEVLIHSKDMSESLLIDSFRSAYLNAFKDKETQDQIKKAHKRFRDLLEKRNQIVHGTWWIGKDVFFMANNKPETYGVKTVRKDTGIECVDLPSVHDLEKLIENVRKLRIAFMTLPTVAGNPEKIRELQSRSDAPPATGG